jgi:hypothetical protein
MTKETRLTKQQLHQMAEAERIELAERLGAEDIDDKNKKDLVDYIFDNQEKLSEEIAEAKDGDEVEPVVMRGKKYKHFSGKKRKIIVSESDKEGDPNFVYVGINGEYEAQVPRGVECTVPEEVVHVLQNLAVETHITKDGDKETVRNVNRFSLQMNEPVGA